MRPGVLRRRSYWAAGVTVWAGGLVAIGAQLPWVFVACVLWACVGVLIVDKAVKA